MGDLIELISGLPPTAQAFAMMILGLGAGGFVLRAFIARQKVDQAPARLDRSSLDSIAFAFNDQMLMRQVVEKLGGIQASMEANGERIERLIVAIAAVGVGQHGGPPLRRQRDN